MNRAELDSLDKTALVELVLRQAGRIAQLEARLAEQEQRLAEFERTCGARCRAVCSPGEQALAITEASWPQGWA